MVNARGPNRKGIGAGHRAGAGDTRGAYAGYGSRRRPGRGYIVVRFCEVAGVASQEREDHRISAFRSERNVKGSHSRLRAGKIHFFFGVVDRDLLRISYAPNRRSYIFLSSRSRIVWRKGYGSSALCIRYRIYA